MRQRDFFKLAILILGVTAVAFFVFLLTSEMFVEAFCFAAGCGLMCLLQWCAEQKCKDDVLHWEGSREGREVRYKRVYDAELGKLSAKDRQPKVRSCCDCQCEKKEIEIKDKDTNLHSSKELKGDGTTTSAKKSKSHSKKSKSRTKRSKSRASSKSSSRKRSRRSKKSRKGKKNKSSA